MHGGDQLVGDLLEASEYNENIARVYLFVPSLDAYCLGFEAELQLLCL